MSEKLYSSSMLQQVAGCSRKAMRVYQDRGLIEPCRSTGTRRYDSEALARLRFIVALRKLGVSIKDISQLLAVRDGYEMAAPAARELSSQIGALVQQVTDQIELMRQLRNQLIISRETLLSCGECASPRDACRSCAEARAIDPITEVLLVSGSSPTSTPQ